MAIVCVVYVFLGDPLALIDFMRALDAMGLNNGEYLVIAVQDNTFQPTTQTKYFKKCKLFLLNFITDPDCGLACSDDLML